MSGVKHHIVYSTTHISPENENMLNLSNTSLDSRTRLNNVCYSLVTLRNDMSSVFNEVEGVVNSQSKNLSIDLRKINLVIQNQLMKERKSWEERLEKQENERQLQIEELKKCLQKQFNDEKLVLYEQLGEEKICLQKLIQQEQKKHKEEILHQKEVVKMLEQLQIQFNENLKEIMSWQKESANLLTEIRHMPNKLIEMMSENESKLNNFNQEIWTEFLTQIEKRDNDGRETLEKLLVERKEAELAFECFQREEIKKQIESLKKQIFKESKTNIQTIEKILIEQDLINTKIFALTNQINVLFSNQKMTKLHKACKKNSIRKLNELLDHGEDVNVINENGDTPLHFAILNKNMMMVEKLMQHNANLNSKNKFCVTPLWLAVCNDADIVQCLLINGANPNISLIHGLTALHLAVLKRDCYVIKMLLDYNANVSSTIKGMITPINMAVILQWDDVLGELKNFCSNPENNCDITDCERFVFCLSQIIAPVNENDILKTFSFNLLYHLTLISTYKPIIGKSGIILMLMKHLDYHLSFHNFSIYITAIWRILCNLTVSTPENCKILLNNNCMEYFIKCYSLFPQELNCLSFMLDTINNISEVKSHCHKIIVPMFISILLKLIDLPFDTIDQVIKIFGHILSDDPEVWNIATPTREEVSLKIKSFVADLPLDKPSHITYDSLESIFEFLTHFHNNEVQLCGAWLLGNIMQTQPEKYLPYLGKEDGLSKLICIRDNALTKNNVKLLIQTVISTYNALDIIGKQ